MNNASESDKETISRLNGLYLGQLSDDDYHDDPCEQPSLSSSIAKILWMQSPRHAWYAHPRLNLDFVRKEKKEFDLGSAAHDVLLEGDTGKIAIVDAKDWRTKAAQEARDNAYAEKRIPVLPHQYQAIRDMIKAAIDYLEETELFSAFMTSEREATLMAEYKGIHMRSKLDVLSQDRRIIMDYKTVGQSANPAAFARQALFNQGHDIQAAFYTLNNYLNGGPDPKEQTFIWMVQENMPPYACSLVGASPAIMEVGEHKVEWCVNKWRECIESGNWHAYDTRIAFPDVPPWELARVQEQCYEESSE